MLILVIRIAIIDMILRRGKVRVLLSSVRILGVGATTAAPRERRCGRGGGGPNLFITLPLTLAVNGGTRLICSGILSMYLQK